MIIYCLLSGSTSSLAQTNTEFTPSNQFSIPANNGTINFLVNGTYAEANQENGIWTFTDLHLAASLVTMPKLDLSVENCNITIRSISRFSSLQSSGTIRYNMTGQGTQTFNFNLVPKEREWSVIFDGEFTPEGKGWHLANGETIIVTRPASNITIFYMDFPADVVQNNNLPFYQQHSATITTVAIVALVVIAAAILQIKNPKNKNAEAHT
jgi:hypothetical protein